MGASHISRAREGRRRVGVELPGANKKIIIFILRLWVVSRCSCLDVWGLLWFMGGGKMAPSGSIREGLNSDESEADQFCLPEACGTEWWERLAERKVREEHGVLGGIIDLPTSRSFTCPKSVMTMLSPHLSTASPNYRCMISRGVALNNKINSASL